ncbi:hypothetical protein [Kribbella sp. NPDC051620]|uniref:hypothetical protein n=1 Tax=Kribbella sp. NPDC051620 TaxID=3364120 RepID=UPI003788EC8D
MKSIYRVLAILISVGVLIQVMAIGLAWFTALKDVDDGLVIDKNYDGNFGHHLHSVVGTMVIPLLAILLLIVSFFARVNGGIKWALIVFGLVVLQIALAFASFSVPVIGALHAANALALAGVAGIAAKQAAAVREPTQAGTEATF